MDIIELIVVIFVGLIVIYYLSVLLSGWRQRGKKVSDIIGNSSVQQSSWQVYYFHSPNCGACRSMTPIFKEQAKNCSSVHCVDVSADGELARQFNVRATPTAILVEEGRVLKVLLGTGLLKQVKQFILEHKNDEN